MKILFLIFSIIVVIHNTRSQTYNTFTRMTATSTQSGGSSNSNTASVLNSAIDGINGNCIIPAVTKLQEAIKSNSAIGNSNVVKKFQTEAATVINNMQQCTSSITDAFLKRNCEVSRAVNAKCSTLTKTYSSIYVRSGGNTSTCEASLTSDAITKPLSAQSSISSDQSTSTTCYIGMFTTLFNCVISCLSSTYSLANTIAACGTSVTCIETAISGSNITAYYDCFGKVCTNATIEACLVNTTKVTAYVENTAMVPTSLSTCTQPPAS